MSDKGTPEGSKVLFGTPTTSRQVGFQFTNPEFASALGFENQITTYSQARSDFHRATMHAPIAAETVIAALFKVATGEIVKWCLATRQN